MMRACTLKRLLLCERQPFALALQLLGLFAVCLPALALSAELPPDAEWVPLHNGINKVDFGDRAVAGMVMLAHRENFNAHSFEMATFYLRTAAVESDPKAWQVIPFEVKTEEGIDKNYLRVWGGGRLPARYFPVAAGSKRQSYLRAESGAAARGIFRWSGAGHFHLVQARLESGRHPRLADSVIQSVEDRDNDEAVLRRG